MKTMYKLLSLYAILAFVSSCQPEDSNDTDDPNGPCAEFNSIAITGPTIA